MRRQTNGASKLLPYFSFYDNNYCNRIAAEFFSCYFSSQNNHRHKKKSCAIAFALSIMNGNRIECRMHFFNTMGQCAVCGCGRGSSIMQQVFFVVCSMLLRDTSTPNLWPFIDHFYVSFHPFIARKSRFEPSSNVEFFIGFRISKIILMVFVIISNFDRSRIILMITVAY